MLIYATGLLWISGESVSFLFTQVPRLQILCLDMTFHGHHVREKSCTGSWFSQEMTNVTATHISLARANHVVTSDFKSHGEVRSYQTPAQRIN